MQIAVAVLVAMLGIVNTLTVSITDRRRELGVLQAVGGAARADPPHDLDRGAEHRRARARARASRSAPSTCTTSCRSCTATSPGMRLDYEFPVRHRAARWCRRFWRRVRRGDLAGGVGGPRVARGGTGI